MKGATLQPEEEEEIVGASETALSASPVATVDDALDKAAALVAALRTLAGYKHPLGIRRAREGVRREMVENVKTSRTLKAGAKTYFFDVRLSSEGHPYLTITESRFKREGEERERHTIVVFEEDAKKFSRIVGEMAEAL